jgi:hypothetical protein
MGFRFRKSVKIGPGVRLNFSKKGTGISFGGKGFRYSISSSGRHTRTISVPGTGMSWMSTSGSGSRRQRAVTLASLSNLPPPPHPPYQRGLGHSRSLDSLLLPRRNASRRESKRS